MLLEVVRQVGVPEEEKRNEKEEAGWHKTLQDRNKKDSCTLKKERGDKRERKREERKRERKRKRVEEEQKEGWKKEVE